jgi:hypothetical protein
LLCCCWELRQLQALLLQLVLLLAWVRVAHVGQQASLAWEPVDAVAATQQTRA